MVKVYCPMCDSGMGIKCDVVDSPQGPLFRSWPIFAGHKDIVAMVPQLVDLMTSDEFNASCRVHGYLVVNEAKLTEAIDRYKATGKVQRLAATPNPHNVK
jgi:hypothetical protein